MISVIVPAYNAEKTIRRCLESVLNGQFSDFELIVVNNGSTDNTENIIKEIASQDERVILITQDNQGPAGSRDTGLQNARGEYVAWCDSDDWYEPDFLEFLYKRIKEYDADIVLCRAQIPDRDDVYDSEAIWQWDRDGAINAFLEHKLLNGVLWNKLIKKELFDSISFDLSLCYWEDLQVVWKILKRAKKVVRFNKAKYNFFVHSDSACAQRYSPSRVNASLKVWGEIVKDCSNGELSAYYDKAISQRYSWLYSDLRMMLKDDYKKQEDLRKVQSILRETGHMGRKSLSGIHRVFAWVCERNLLLAKLVIKIMH